MSTASLNALLPWLALIPCVAIWAYSLVDFSQTDERDMRTFNRDTWLVLLVLGSVVGGLAWLIAGRPQPPGLRRHG
ncbi:PLDc N-terminal domain-containing protein [Pseudarthrobacter sp. fls2-241-R2A-127]|uniref:PLDc N-terminal domain-containing protein n=1 Tax=Pseudarthrobacter sp. fls2-241-R2A-127 TaxID=3040303 RepID=UPI002553F053|nr:PLDc N-terminal domain-containing protein [Pseudarthrobacter sp. fls2-241-R2A-127]